MGNGVTVRYMGGKKLEKYFDQDCWPLYHDVLDLLGFTEETAFALFRSFVAIDADQNGRVDVQELFNFIGGRPTRFTKRVFHNQFQKANGDIEVIGLNFIEFIKVLWNFCTMSYFTLAQYVFEVMDIDNVGVLEKEDVETMYRMLYDCPMHDLEAVNLYPYYTNQVFKLDFCKVSSHVGLTNRNQMLIQPAIDFQMRVRKKIGGKKFWVPLLKHRQTYFYEIDRKSDTVPSSMEEIIEQGKLRPPKVIDAEMLMEQRAKQLQDDQERLGAELAIRENEVAGELRRLKLNAEDQKMMDAKKAYDRDVERFEKEEFTTNDSWQRHERRMELFELHDAYIDASKEYWEWKDEKDMNTAIGNDDDHEARYQDLLKDEAFKVIHDVRTLLEAFKEQKKIIDEKNAKNKKYSDYNKKDKQILIESNLTEMKRLYDLIYDDPEQTPEAIAKHIEKLKVRNFDEENKIAKKYCSRKDLAAAEQIAHEALRQIWRERHIESTRKEIAENFEERRKDYIRNDFKIASGYGSRITRWEYCLDKGGLLCTCYRIYRSSRCT